MNLIRLTIAIMTWTWMLTFPLSGLSGAQTYRDIGLPPSEIFEKMIVYAQEKDFEKLSKTLQLVKPITQAVGTKYSKNPEEEVQNAIQKKSGEKALEQFRAGAVID